MKNEGVIETQEDLGNPEDVDNSPKYKSFCAIFLMNANYGLSGFYVGISLVYISTVSYQTIRDYYSIENID